MIRYHARWVLPISAPPIEQGTVAVADGRIAYVGARAAAPAGTDVELGEAILMPGLVNVHTHLELTVLRGFLEDLDFPQWIVRLNQVKRAVLDRDRLLDSARLGLVEGIRAGVTTYADTCDSGVAFPAMIEAGVRGIMYQEVFGPDPAQCDASLAGLREKVGALRAQETALVRVGVSPHAPYTVSDVLYREVAAYAVRDGLPLAAHIAESRAEDALVQDGEGFFADGLRTRGIAIAPRARTSIALLEENGIFAARPLLIHCVQVTPDDLLLLHRHRNACAVAHCPLSNAKLAHGTAPLSDMLARGLVVGLGSDSVASNNRMDLIAEARAAVLAQRARTRRHDIMSARDALHLATLGGARALGIEAITGSLDVGKSADLAAFPLDDGVQPVHDPEAAVVFALPGVPASLVTVAGRELVRDRRLVAFDRDLPARIANTARLMREWTRV